MDCIVKDELIDTAELIFLSSKLLMAPLSFKFDKKFTNPLPCSPKKIQNVIHSVNAMKP